MQLQSLRLCFISFVVCLHDTCWKISCREIMLSDYHHTLLSSLAPTSSVYLSHLHGFLFICLMSFLTPLNLARASCVAMDLKVSIGACWVHSGYTAGNKEFSWGS